MCSIPNILDLGNQNVGLNSNVTVFPEIGQFCQKVNLDYLDSIKVNTQTGFLSNDAQEEFNFTSQSLLDYVGDTSIKDSFFNPRGTLKSLENKEFPDARVCGNGEIGQPKAPNSYLEETFANPEIRYPNITIDGSGNYEISDSNIIDSYVDDGGTLYVYKRGKGEFLVDSNTGIAQENSDMACFEVPKCPYETKNAGGRCLCLGLDFTNGIPPSKNWTEISPCLKKVKCPDQLNNGHFESVEITDSHTINLWQFDTTKAFQINHPKQVKDHLEFFYGHCNPFATT